MCIKRKYLTYKQKNVLHHELSHNIIKLDISSVSQCDTLPIISSQIQLTNNNSGHDLKYLVWLLLSIIEGKKQVTNDLVWEQ